MMALSFLLVASGRHFPVRASVLSADFRANLLAMFASRLVVNVCIAVVVLPELLRPIRSGIEFDDGTVASALYR